MFFTINALRFWWFCTKPILVKIHYCNSSLFYDIIRWKQNKNVKEQTNEKTMDTRGG